jgi:hypothetical protein
MTFSTMKVVRSSPLCTGRHTIVELANIAGCKKKKRFRIRYSYRVSTLNMVHQKYINVAGNNSSKSPILCHIKQSQLQTYEHVSILHRFTEVYTVSSSLGVTTSYIESFSLLNDISPFTTILDAVCPILNLHFTNVLFTIVIPSALRSSL